MEKGTERSEVRRIRRADASDRPHEGRAGRSDPNLGDLVRSGDGRVGPPVGGAPDRISLADAICWSIGVVDDDVSESVKIPRRRAGSNRESRNAGPSNIRS
jgi:hypothetical protein